MKLMSSAAFLEGGCSTSFSQATVVMDCRGLFTTDATIFVCFSSEIDFLPTNLALATFRVVRNYSTNF